MTVRCPRCKVGYIWRSWDTLHCVCGWSLEPRRAYDLVSPAPRRDKRQPATH